jgi:hypothetical protein
MPRNLVWIKRSTFEGFGCSECEWEFKSTKALVGKTFDQMKQTYEAERDKEFAAREISSKSPCLKEGACDVVNGQVKLSQA